MSEQQSKAEQLERKRVYWERQIKSWQSSGMTQVAFCKEHDLKPHQFTYWKKRFVQIETGIRFVPIKFHHRSTSVSDMDSPSLRLIVNRDLQIEVRQNFDPQLLRKVIAAIRTLP
jgi:hypothetical protein